MARQDIFGCISDDILGERGCTSSLKGKVKDIKVWINTDVAGESTCNFTFDKDNKNVDVHCRFPKKWNLTTSHPIE